jgi:hypothetical protein
MFRFRKGDELRIYSLRAVPGGAELWRTTTVGEEAVTSIMEEDFTHLEAAIDTLRELEQRLRAGGWKKG